MTSFIWERWVQLYRELSRTENNLAAPFVPFIPTNYVSQRHNALYIGKATAGDCDKKQFDMALSTSNDEARKMSECFSRYVFERSVGKSGPSFWGFANDLSRVLEVKAQNLENLCWSNVCKIGEEIKNPEGRVFEEQIPLAVETLRDEIAVLNPSIIVCVANSYADRILLPAIGQPTNDAWEKSESTPSFEVDNVWWLPRRAESPPVLWMRHPQSSSLTLRQFALQKVVDLISAD